MENNLINIIFLDCVGFFIFSFLCLTISFVLILSSMSDELDYLIKENHDSAVW